MPWFKFWQKDRKPSPRRVGARAMALASVVARADLERDLDDGDHNLEENEQARHRLIQWVKEAGLKSELEPAESSFLKTPMGQARERTIIDAGWRQEGLAVLAWALQRYELPTYDEGADQIAMAKCIGFFRPVGEQDLRRFPTLRLAPEISRFSSHITIVSWRLRQFRLVRRSSFFEDASQIWPSGQTGIGEPMDFVEYLDDLDPQMLGRSSAKASPRPRPL